MARWWPLQTAAEKQGKRCGVCHSTTGLSQDDRGRVYCPAHRDRHNN